MFYTTHHRGLLCTINNTFIIS